MIYREKCKRLFVTICTTLTVPNLVVNDLFLVKPMASFTGFLTYLKFAFSVEKGGVKAGQIYMNESPFTYAPMSEDRANYTSDRVVETIEASATSFTPAWTPLAVDPEDNTKYQIYGELAADEPSPGTGKKGDWVQLTVTSGSVSFTAGTYSRIKYVYDNIVIPQEKLPQIKAEMDSLTLEARARRIAVTYSQIAAFQAKQDYGIDFEATINKQAQAELQYQIDGEAIYMIQNAWEDGEFTADTITWADANPDTISYSMRAEGFARAIEQAKMKVFVRTQKLTPTWMLVSPDIMPVLTFVPGFKGNSNAITAGAYLAGDIAGLKVICSPAVAQGSAYLGVLGNDGVTATGIFAPYMPLVPTQLLGFADGTMTQGFSTLYDMKILNPALLQKIKVTSGPVGGLDVNIVGAGEAGKLDVNVVNTASAPVNTKEVQ